MDLTHDIIDMTYKFAHTYLRRIGRGDIDHHDLAHDAFVKLAKASPVAAEHLRHKVWLDIITAFRDYYTNTTTRKHNVLLDAVHAEFDMVSYDPDTVAAKDEFIRALKLVYWAEPTACEILMLILNGKTVQEIATMRGTCVQAVDHLKQKAKRELAAVLGIAV